MKKEYIFVIVLCVLFLIVVLGIYYLNNRYDIIDLIDEKIHNVSKEKHYSNEGVLEIENQIKILDLKKYLRRYDFEEPQIAEYYVSEITERNIEKLEKITDSIDITTLEINQKVRLDFDSDGSYEKIYILSNVKNEKINNWITAIIYEDNGNLYSLFNQKYNQNSIDLGIKYELINIVDFNNDGLYEIIIKPKVSGNDNSSNCYNLYELINGEFKKVIECDLLSSVG